jgi:ADP-heptose:LPS heptosyltransferase
LIEWRHGFGILPRASNLFEEARLIRALDLVISVDTMPAHLAGALGVPVWTLLPAEADWRWMDGRYDSPWYPTMRLFRQEEDGVWEPVIMRVAAALKRLTTGGRSVLVPEFGRPQKERMLPQELPQTPQRLLP